MLEVLIPYIEAPEFTLVDRMPSGRPLVFQIFGPLVAIGLFAGRNRLYAYARRKDMDLTVVGAHVLWTLIAAFVISHWVSVLLYYPEQLQKDPWLLLKIWNGLSSVGGFFGAFVGGYLFLRVYLSWRPVGAQPILVYSDMSVFGLLTGWAFGRLGCSLVHDHPGRIVPEGTFMAVGPWPDGTWRYDLGLIELCFTIALLLLVYFVLRWDRWPPGRLTGLVLTVYAPFRFMLDTLRAEEASKGVLDIPDARYLDLTPAQWFTMLFLVVGLWLLWRTPTAADQDYARESDRLRREAEAKKGKQTKKAEPAKAEAKKGRQAEPDEPDELDGKAEPDEPDSSVDSR